MTFAEALPLFAQAGGGFAPAGGGGAAGGGMSDTEAIIFIVIYAIAIIAALAIAILYMMSLSRALQQCAPRNRTMEPGQVWLNFIPCFGLVWMFITVSRIAESLSNEFRDRGMRSEGDFGRGIGITYLVLNLTSVIPIVGYATSLAGLVCWIIYWVKIAGYTKQLREGESFRDDEDREYRRRYDEGDYRPERDRDDDRDDDRPSRRRRDEPEDDLDDDRPSRRRRDDD